MELILSRQTIRGGELAQRGLVNRTFKPDEDVVLEAKRLAARIAGYSRPVIGMAKQAVLAGMSLPQLQRMHFKRIDD
jgi:enoyl-CoA hydratase/carnithine racemase